MVGVDINCMQLGLKGMLCKFGIFEYGFKEIQSQCHFEQSEKSIALIVRISHFVWNDIVVQLSCWLQSG